MKLITFFLTLCLFASTSSFAATPKTVQKPQKQRVVLMPIKVSEEDRSLSGAMETALVEGLQDRYTVFSGERVQQKAREIFNKESKSAKAECDETKCMEDIAIAFQAELIAVANVTKRLDGYFLAISIQNIFDNKVVYSKSIPCKNSDSYEVIEKLKELGGREVATTIQSSSVNLVKVEDTKEKIPMTIPINSEVNKKINIAAKLKAENAKGVWIDKATNLMWQDNEDAKTINKDWQGAKDYCENLTLADYDDWHLPTKDELLELFPKIKVLKNQPSWIFASEYWSSSESDLKAWQVSLRSGEPYLQMKHGTRDLYIRCIRENK